MFTHPKLIEVLSETRFSPELECYADRHGVRSDLQAAGLDWQIDNDESLSSGGIELTPRSYNELRGLAGLEQIRQVCEIIERHAIGEAIRAGCGTHVHVDFTGVSDKAVVNVFRRYIAYEKAIDRLHAPSRRDGNSMARPMMSSVTSHADSDFERTKQWLSQINGCKGRHDVCRLFGHDTKFWKVNPHHLEGYGSIEFRQHVGTINYEKLAHWIVFLAMLRWTTIHFPSTKVPSKEVMDHKQRLRKLLQLVVGDWSPETVKYLLARARHFDRLTR